MVGDATLGEQLLYPVRASPNSLRVLKALSLPRGAWAPIESLSLGVGDLTCRGLRSAIGIKTGQNQVAGIGCCYR